MSSIFDLLAEQVTAGGMDAIQRQLGTDEATTRKAVPAALGTLLGALANNSTQSSGAEALLGALKRDHDGGLLDNLSGYLANPQEAIGTGILKHVLGGNRGSVENSLGQSLGLDSRSAGKLLTMLAPVVMSALGRARREQSLDAGSLASMLGGERKRVTQKAPDGLGALGSLLDQDGDGQIGDDVAKLGAGLLKNFLSRR